MISEELELLLCSAIASIHSQYPDITVNTNVAGDLYIMLVEEGGLFDEIAVHMAETSDHSGNLFDEEGRNNLDFSCWGIWASEDELRNDRNDGFEFFSLEDRQRVVDIVKGMNTVDELRIEGFYTRNTGRIEEIIKIIQM